MSNTSARELLYCANMVVWAFVAAVILMRGP
jgi:hypothetical protein